MMKVRNVRKNTRPKTRTKRKRKRKGNANTNIDTDTEKRERALVGVIKNSTADISIRLVNHTAELVQLREYSGFNVTQVHLPGYTLRARAIVRLYPPSKQFVSLIDIPRPKEKQNKRSQPLVQLQGIKGRIIFYEGGRGVCRFSFRFTGFF